MRLPAVATVSFLALAGPLLSGCVAAALPVLAAGGVLGTQTRGKGEARRAPPEVTVASPAATVAVPIRDNSAMAAPSTVTAAQPGITTRTYTAADGTRMEVMTGPVTQRAPDPVPAPASIAPAPVRPDPARATAGAAGLAMAPAKPAAPMSYTLDDGTRVQVLSGPMPPPAGAGPGVPGFAGYEGFVRYAGTLGTVPVIGSERSSALLANPGTLSPAKRMCSIHPAAVMVDLDPGAGLLDPAVALRGDSRLAQALAALRAQGVTVAWLSANTADKAGSVRRALAAAGLDPAGRDELVLLRYPEERKQTRREDFAKAFCVVAIAGDERSDFDELFQYLKNPSTASALDPLFGNGWFVIPQPLT